MFKYQKERIMKMVSLKQIGFLGLAVGLVFLAGTDVALATGSQDFAGSVNKVGQQAAALPKFIQFICYVLGIAIVAKGILAGKKYSENPSDVKNGLLGILGPLAVGGLLIALPAVSDLAIKSTLSNDTSTKTFQSGAFSTSY